MKKLTLLAVLLLAAGCSGNVKRSAADALRRDPYEFLAERLSASRDGALGRKVAVLPFAYTDRRQSDDGVVISERLLTRIIQEGRLEVVERSLLAKVMGELKLQNSGVMDAASIKSLGRVLGVDAVVTGTLTRQGDGSVEINARMIKAETAVVLTAAAATVPADWEASSSPAPAEAPGAAPVQTPSAVQAPAPAAQPFPGAWRYRENFRVAERSGAALTDYQVAVVFDSAAAIRLGRMKADCSDVRFANSDEKTALPFWLEGGCGTAQAKAWVRLPFLARNAVKNIYMYYGNQSAVSSSDGDATFQFFDDFGKEGLDRSKWTELPGACRYYLRGGHLEFEGCSYGNETRMSWVRTAREIRPPFKADFDSYAQDAGENGLFHVVGLRWDGTLVGGYNSLREGTAVTFYDGCSLPASKYSHVCGRSEVLSFSGGAGRALSASDPVLSPATLRRCTVSDDSRSISSYCEGRMLTSAEVDRSAGGFIGLSVREYPRQYTGYFDNFRVRAYAAVEPEVYPFRPTPYTAAARDKRTR